MSPSAQLDDTEETAVPTYETLLYEENDEGVATVTLNRPEVLNAFNVKMREELQHLWKFLRGHDAVRAIILTGAGDKAWCTGIDRHESLENYPARTARRRAVSRTPRSGRAAGRTCSTTRASASTPRRTISGSR